MTNWKFLEIDVGESSEAAQVQPVGGLGDGQSIVPKAGESDEV